MCCIQILDRLIDKIKADFSVRCLSNRYCNAVTLKYFLYEDVRYLAVTR